MALAENYPQLRADQSFLNLQHELSDTENRIAERRHAYNQTVNNYLNQIMSVPSNIVADFHAWSRARFFDVPDADVAQPPKSNSHEAQISHETKPPTVDVLRRVRACSRWRSPSTASGSPPTPATASAWPTTN